MANERYHREQKWRRTTKPPAPPYERLFSIMPQGRLETVEDVQFVVAYLKANPKLPVPNFITLPRRCV